MRQNEGMHLPRDPTFPEIRKSETTDREAGDHFFGPATSSCGFETIIASRSFRHPDLSGIPERFFCGGTCSYFGPPRGGSSFPPGWHIFCTIDDWRL